VIFDLDGTLVDSIGLIVDSYQNGFRQALGHEWDETEIRTWIGLSLSEALEQVFPDQPDTAATVYAGYMSWNEAHMATDLTAYPGIADLMAELAGAGLRLGAVTSKRAKNAVWSLELAGLTDTVPLLVSHDDTDRHKPDPAPLLLAASKLGVKPESCVYVGDAASDIEAAHRAGMAGIAVTWGAGTPDDLAAAQPAVVCDSIAQLRAALLATT